MGRGKGEGGMDGMDGWNGWNGWNGNGWREWRTYSNRVPATQHFGVSDEVEALGSISSTDDGQGSTKVQAAPGSIVHIGSNTTK